MAKIKYDVSGDIPETGNAPVGWYRGEVVSAEEKKSRQGNQMVEVQIRLTHDAAGNKIGTDDYWPVRQYLMVEDDRPYALRTIREFIQAVGGKLKGELDTNKLAGKKLSVKLKADTDQDGEYQPRIAKLVKLGDEDGAAVADEPEPEGEEPEPEEPEGEEEEEESIDLDSLDRNALKKLIKDEGLDIKVFKSMSDDDVRGAIAEAMGAEEPEGESEEEEEEEPEPESEPEPEAAEGGGDTPDYDSMSVADLRAELKERELATGGGKSVLIKRLKDDDTDNPF